MLLRYLLGLWLVMVAVTAAAGPRSLAEGPRVVSADGSVTEVIYALGAESRLVGVDSTSRYPAAVSWLPSVGYLRALPFEGILALRPDLLLTTEEAAPETNLDRLSRAGVDVIRLPVVRSSDELVQRILRIGEVLGYQTQAEALARTTVDQVDTLISKYAVGGRPPRVLFLLAAGNHGLMIGGRNTAADALLTMLGAENAMAAVEGYKPVNREAILASQPDAVVVAESVRGRFDIRNWREVSALNAWQKGHYTVADSMFLLGFGPRLPDALAEVAKAFPLNVRELVVNER